MNKKLLVPLSFFIGFNFLINLFYFFISTKGDPIQSLLWLTCFIFIYAMSLFLNPNMKINWFAYSGFFIFLGFCLNETTFKNFKLSHYNFDHFFSIVNKNVFYFINNHTQSLLNNFQEFSININIFSLLIIVTSVFYFLLFKNKYINQVVCENFFFCIFVVLLITTIFPVRTTSDVFENIGKGDLAILNDKLSFFTHYLYFSSVSLQITLFTFISLLIVKENWFIGLTLFIVLILLCFSHITLNYSQFCEVILAIVTAFCVYFFKVQPSIGNYSRSISFFK